MAERRIIDSIYGFWALLTLPAIWFLAERFVLYGKVAFVPWTGILSCWLLIVTMAVTPLQMIFGPLPWLKKRRRYLGVASFGYALLHTFFWLINTNLHGFIRSFFRLEILTGWIGFAIMVALAVTSTDSAVRSMGPKWKSLQRWVYPAAVLTLLHWLMTDEAGWTMIFVYSGPLIALEAWRLWRYRSRIARA